LCSTPVTIMPLSLRALEPRAEQPVPQSVKGAGRNRKARADQAARRAFSLIFSITQHDALLDVAGAAWLVWGVVVGEVPVDAARTTRPWRQDLA
jgi:hypothetical protein